MYTENSIIVARYSSLDERPEGKAGVFSCVEKGGKAIPVQIAREVQ